MTIIEDTGQKQGQHDNIAAWCKAHGVTLRRQKLNVGDYQSPPQIAVDTKKGMAEIYSDIVSDHERFRNECLRAQEDGITLVILIESEDITSLEEAKHWKNPRITQYERTYGLVLRAQKAGKMLDKKIPKPPVPSERLVGMMDAMHLKYGVIFTFCHPRNTGEEVYRILTGGESQLLKNS